MALEGLQVGDLAPKIVVHDIDGEKFDLVRGERPLVLVFYRGSWCPYCIKQLMSIDNEVYPKIKKKIDLIGISVDKKSVVQSMRKKFSFSFNLASDVKAKILKAFKVVNQLDPKLVKKYKESYRIDVEGDSGETHHMVAHPAVFILKKGKVVFSDIHINYKDRTDNKVVLKHLGIQ